MSISFCKQQQQQQHDRREIRQTTGRRNDNAICNRQAREVYYRSPETIYTVRSPPFFYLPIIIIVSSTVCQWTVGAMGPK